MENNIAEFQSETSWKRCLESAAQRTVDLMLDYSECALIAAGIVAALFCGRDCRGIFRAKQEACPKWGTAAWVSITLPVRLESLPLLIRLAWIGAKSTPPGGQ